MGATVLDAVARPAREADVLAASGDPVPVYLQLGVCVAVLVLSALVSCLEGFTPLPSTFRKDKASRRSRATILFFRVLLACALIAALIPGTFLGAEYLRTGPLASLAGERTNVWMQDVMRQSVNAYSTQKLVGTNITVGVGPDALQPESFGAIRLGWSSVLVLAAAAAVAGALLGVCAESLPVTRGIFVFTYAQGCAWLLVILGAAFVAGGGGQLPRDASPLRNKWLDRVYASKPAAINETRFLENWVLQANVNRSGGGTERRTTRLSELPDFRFAFCSRFRAQFPNVTTGNVTAGNATAGVDVVPETTPAAAADPANASKPAPATTAPDAAPATDLAPAAAEPPPAEPAKTAGRAPEPVARIQVALLSASRQARQPEPVEPAAPPAPPAAPPAPPAPPPAEPEPPAPVAPVDLPPLTADRPTEQLAPGATPAAPAPTPAAPPKSNRPPVADPDRKPDPPPSPTPEVMWGDGQEGPFGNVTLEGLDRALRSEVLVAYVIGKPIGADHFRALAYLAMGMLVAAPVAMAQLCKSRMHFPFLILWFFPIALLAVLATPATLRAIAAPQAKSERITFCGETFTVLVMDPVTRRIAILDVVIVAVIVATILVRGYAWLSVGERVEEVAEKNEVVLVDYDDVYEPDSGALRW